MSGLCNRVIGRGSNDYIITRLVKEDAERNIKES